MPERYRGDAAGWVWALTALLPLGALVGAAALLLVLTDGAILVQTEAGGYRPADGVAWIAGAILLIGLSGLLAVPTNSGNRLTPAYIAVAAMPLLSEAVRDPEQLSRRIFTFDSAMVAIFGGLAVLWIIRAARGGDPRNTSDRFIRRLAVFTTYVFVFEAIVDSELLLTSQWRRLVLFTVSAAAAFVVEVVLDVTLSGRLLKSPLRYAISSASTDAMIFVSLMATGALFGLAYEAIGAWALAVAILPYAFTAGAFRRLDQTKRTYEQTIIALSRIPEVGGHTHPGHAERTNELALAVADRIGVSPLEREWINYAAYLHDIGRITLNEPSILRQGFTEIDIAQWGSEIVGETSYLDEVAAIVRRQHEPFRSPGEQANPDLPLASRIIKACSAYDEATAELGLSPLEALERLHRGGTYDFDPDVTNQLREVLERRGALNHPVSMTNAGG